MHYFSLSQVLTVQKHLKGSEITTLRLQGVPLEGDNLQSRMNVPSLLHIAVPIFHQVALHGFKTETGNRWELLVLPLFMQNLFGQKRLFLWLLAILDKKFVSGWSKMEGCNPNFFPLSLFGMQYDTVWYSFDLYSIELVSRVSFNRLLQVSGDGWHLKNCQLLKVSIFICDPCLPNASHAVQALFGRGNCYFCVCFKITFTILVYHFL